MEPPAKRRRHAKSPPATAGDDDELCFEPVELSARRDAGFRLSIQRAYADNRFQATMAHIFDKYSRDFDGIGDEIDMVSGEIVVDNGHLQNMRDEGDVGPAASDGDDHRESLSLRRLGDDGDDDEEDEEDDIMYGRKSARQSRSLVPVSASRRPASPALLGPGGPLDFASRLAFGASPLTFGAPPFAPSSWLWEPPSMLPRASRLLPSSPGERYILPAHGGGSSIWSPNYRFKDNDDDEPSPGPLGLTSLRSRPRTRTRPMKSICPSAVPQSAADEEVDEDAILTGKSLAPDQRPSRRECHDDVFTTQATPTLNLTVKKRKPQRHPDKAAPRCQREKMPRSPSGRFTSKKNRSKDACKGRGATLEAPSKPQSVARDYGGSEARQRISVEIALIGQLCRDEYVEVDAAEEIFDDAAEEIDDLVDEELAPAGCLSPVDELHPADSERLKEAVARGEGASQNTTTLEEAPGGPRKAPDTCRMASSSAFYLSDDEMPIWSKPRRAARVRRGREAPTVKPPPSEPPDSGIGDEASTLSSTDDASPRASPSIADALALPPAPAQPERRPDPSPPGQDGSRRLTRELRWLRKTNGPPPDESRAPGDPLPCRPATRTASRAAPRAAESGSEPEPEPEPAPRRRGAQGSPAGLDEAPPPAASQRDSPPPSPEQASRPAASPPAPSTQERTPPASPSAPCPPAPARPRTPRRAAPRPARAPSSRRSILSLVSPDAVAAAAAVSSPSDDDEGDLDDELGRGLAAAAAAAAAFVGSGASRKIWKSSARTTEVYHTPVKRRPTEALSPGSIVQTPGGTLRACGVAGYRCGRDFCFSCL